MNGQQGTSHSGRPGRKAGHAGKYRPRPDHVDQEIEVPLRCCPHCGGAVCDKSELLQYIEEIPVVRPHVTRLITQEGWCAHCQKEIYSTHPLQTSRASGAAATQLALGVLGEKFAGVLVSDCLSIYDDINPLQQKCYSHHLKAVSEALELAAAAQSAYLLEVQALLRTALWLKALQGAADQARFALCVNTLKGRAHALLDAPRAGKSAHAIMEAA